MRQSVQKHVEILMSYINKDNISKYECMLGKRATYYNAILLFPVPHL